jgi:hypothetical protein
MKNFNDGHLRRSRRPFLYWTAGLLGLSLLVVWLALGAAGAWAQTSADSWTEPINLSQSGGANSPRQTIDSAGRIHVVWQDSFDGVIYSRFDGESWSPPVITRLPYGDSLPYVYADAADRLHVLWLDSTGALFYSYVNADDFLTAGLWRLPTRVAESAVAFSLAVVPDGRLHLAYIRALHAADFPAGVYYRQSADNGQSWQVSATLYDSLYYRSVTADDAYLSLTFSDANPEEIYLAWGNRLRDYLRLLRSQDNGQTWLPPTEIDRRAAADRDDAVGPSAVQLHTVDDQLHFFWRGGHEPNVPCALYHQWSSDGGDGMQPRQRLFADRADCPVYVRPLTAADGSLLLLTFFADNAYLSIWDNGRWSEPQPQPEIIRFTDPDTLGRVSLACHSANIAADGSLLLVGCDSGAGKDVWTMSRSVGARPEWFPTPAPPPIWRPSELVGSDINPLFDPVLIGEEGRIHLLWSRADQPGSPGTGIYYARWQDDRWTLPSAILRSPQGKADQLSAAVDDSGRLFAVWSGDMTGLPYFSWANSAQAISPQEWAEPRALPTTQDAGSSPHIIAAPDGTLYVAYAAPINEGRGIYVTLSVDSGDSWSSPVLAADAILAGWDRVDNPRLAYLGDDQLHLIWQTLPLLDGLGERTLYYARSTDGGLTWSAPASFAQGSVYWGRLIVSEGNLLHRFWLEDGATRTTTWHQFSNNNGLVWSQVERATDLPRPVYPAGLVVDAAQRLHLLQLFGPSGGYTLQHWSWLNDIWLAGETTSLILPNPPLGNASWRQLNAATAGLADGGRLLTAYIGVVYDADLALERRGLFFTERALQLPPMQPTPRPTNPPPLEPTPTLAATPMPTPTPPAVFSPERDNRGPVPLNLLTNSYFGAIVALIASGLVVFAVVLIRLSWGRR